MKRRNLLLVLLAFVLHAPSFVRTLIDIDAASYAGIACRLLNGGLPYRDGVENKFPAIFYTYKALFFLFGRYNMLAVHIVVTLVAIATAFTCGAIARTLTPDEQKARAHFWATLFYIVFSASYYPKMLEGNTEMFAVLPSSLALWCYLRARSPEKDRPLYMLLAGALAGVTLLYKQVASATFAAIGADRVLSVLWQRGSLRALRDVILLIVGMVLVVGAMALHLRRLGVWDDAVFWSWTYVFHHYIPTGEAHHAFATNLLLCLLPFLLDVSPLLVLAAVATRAGGRALSPLLWWAVGSLCAALVGGRMYGHYFLLFVPALSALAGIGAASWLDDHKRRVLVRVLVFIATGFFLYAVLYEGVTGAFWRPRFDYRAAAAYVHDHTRPDEQLFVWGWFPALYVSADRCPSTRFVYTHVLSGSGQAGDLGHSVPEGWAMLMHDLEAAPPPYIIDTAPGPYSFPHPIADYPLLAEFVRARYHFEIELGGTKIYRRN